MKKLLLFVIISVFISTIISIGNVSQVSAQDSIKPRILWTLTSEQMKRYNLEPRDIVGVRMNENSTRIFLVEHGYNLPCRLLIFDAATGKLIGGANIEARDVPTFVPNADGTKVFIVTDYGSGAMELDVNSGKTRKVWEKKPAGFRFMIPIGVYTGPDGKYWTRGYYLDSAGKNAGDYLVAFDTSKPGEAKVEKKIDITALYKGTGGNGTMRNLVTNRNRDVVGMVIMKSLREAEIYSAKPGSGKPPKLLDKGIRIKDISMDDSGKSIFYVIDNGKEVRFQKVDTTTGEKFMFDKGEYMTPLTSPEGDRILVTKYPLGGAGQTFYFIDGNKKWKVSLLKVPGFEKGDNLGIYHLGRDGRTFFVWSRDGIQVGTLP